MPKSSSKTPVLSIVILSFNTKSLLQDCLESLRKVKHEVALEVIVVDNASSDGSPEVVKKEFPWVTLIENDKNLGFAAGNNTAKDVVRAKYILFLNSDTVVYPGTLRKVVSYMDSHKNVGALTCKITLPSGELDKDSRRSFPTPWVALTHFSALDRVFPRSKLLSRYWYGWLGEDQVHEVDAIQGAFYFTKKEILDKVGWFDEDYFLDGEDIDLCWKIKSTGAKIVYYPEVSILHVKKASKKKARGKYVNRGVWAMKIFYDKHLKSRYPIYVNLVVYVGIYALMVCRTLKNFFN